MPNSKRQLAAEVIAVVILGTASFLSVSFDRDPGASSARSIRNMSAVQVLAELPKGPARFAR